MRKSNMSSVSQWTREMDRPVSHQKLFGLCCLLDGKRGSLLRRNCLGTRRVKKILQMKLRLNSSFVQSVERSSTQGISFKHTLADSTRKFSATSATWLLAVILHKDCTKKSATCSFMFKMLTNHYDKDDILSSYWHKYIYLHMIGFHFKKRIAIRDGNSTFESSP